VWTAGPNGHGGDRAGPRARNDTPRRHARSAPQARPEPRRRTDLPGGAGPRPGGRARRPRTHGGSPVRGLSCRAGARVSAPRRPRAWHGCSPPPGPR